MSSQGLPAPGPPLVVGVDEQEFLELPFGLCARDESSLSGRRERQQAAWTGEPSRIRAGAVADHRVRRFKYGSHPLGFRQLSQVAGASRHEVMEQQGVAASRHGLRHRIDHGLEREMVGGAADQLPAVRA